MTIHFNENIVDRQIANKLEVDDVSIDAQGVQIWWKNQTPEIRQKCIDTFKVLFPDKYVEKYSIRIRLGQLIDYIYKFS